MAPLPGINTKDCGGEACMGFDPRGEFILIENLNGHEVLTGIEHNPHTLVR